MRSQSIGAKTKTDIISTTNKIINSDDDEIELKMILECMLMAGDMCTSQ